MSGGRLAAPSVRFCAALALFGIFLAAGVQDATAASAGEKRRVEIGLKIFRATLAADLNLVQKLDQQQGLAIVLFYANDRASAERYRERLAEPGGLLEHRLHISLSDDPALRAFSASPPAAMFITEPRLPLATLQSLKTFSARHSRVLFSPFEADVERGVATGLFVGARVQPFVNSRALRASSISLQDFFLDIAKKTD
ncbi:hypothetical protein [Thiorhodovibrio frisius]|uniref:hypothetical protein n=1 Tax=Thiorhodovibrio frisius TaxID=631362 RepID=UPI00117F5E02|nr:hypothetical protein [Thiorhodovibrio frisius]